MSALIFATLSYVLLYKYVALFIVAYLAALLLPLPSNTSLLAASAFASQGYLNISLVIIVALLANVLGDLTGFFLSRRYGKEVLIKIGFRKIIESSRYISLEKFIIKHARITIFVTRFFGGVGPLVNILTGFSKEISFKKFLIYGVSGEFVYVMSLALPGYFLGSSWEDLAPSVEVITMVVLVSVIIFIFSRRHSHHKALPQTITD